MLQVQIYSSKGDGILSKKLRTILTSIQNYFQGNTMSRVMFPIMISTALILTACANEGNEELELNQQGGDGEKIVLAENIEKSVTLTGVEQKSRGMIGPITVRVKNESKTFEWENEINPSFLPELIVSDLDNDGKDEISIFLTKGHGTGVRDSEAHVLREDLTEIIMPNPLEEAKEIVSDSLIISGENREYTVNVAGESYSYSYKESDAGSWFERIVMGNHITYRIEDSLLIASLALEIAPGMTIGDLETTYTLKDGEFIQTKYYFLPIGSY